MIKSKLAHFSLILADNAVRGVIRFNDPWRAKVAQKALGFGRVRAAQLSVGGQCLDALYNALPGEPDMGLVRAIRGYEATYPTAVGAEVDQTARKFAIENLIEEYQRALREAQE